MQFTQVQNDHFFTNILLILKLKFNFFKQRNEDKEPPFTYKAPIDNLKFLNTDKNTLSRSVLPAVLLFLFG